MPKSHTRAQPVNPGSDGDDGELPGRSELLPTHPPAPSQQFDVISNPTAARGGLAGLTWGTAALQRPSSQPLTMASTSLPPVPLARRALGEALEHESIATHAQPHHRQALNSQPNPYQPSSHGMQDPHNSFWQPQQGYGTDQEPEGSDLMSDIQRGHDVTRRVRPWHAGDSPDPGIYQAPQPGGAVARPRKRLLTANPVSSQASPSGFGGSPAQQPPLGPQAAPVRGSPQPAVSPIPSFHQPATHADPFLVADGLRFPTTPFDQPPPPLRPQDMNAGRGPVPLKVSDTNMLLPISGVSNDGRQYGVAEELGVDPAHARMQQSLMEEATRQLDMAGHPGPLLGYDAQGQPLHTVPAPPPGLYSSQAPHQVQYDEDAGMLKAPDVPQLERNPKRQKYIQDIATGRFYRLDKHGLLGGVAKRFMKRRDEGKDDDEDEEQDDDDFLYSDLTRGTLGWDIRSALFVSAAVFSILGLFVQGLLGGFALLNIFMTYMLYSYNGLRLWLRYYGPIGLACSRIYYSLISMSLVASAARLSRDQLRRYAPAHTHLKVVDWLQILLYTAAYITTTLATPLDDQLYYESQRNSRFHMLSFTSDFHSRLASYHVLNLIRIVTSGIAFLLACYRCSPLVSEGVVQHEAVQRAQVLGMFGPWPVQRKHAPNAAQQQQQEQQQQQQEQQQQQRDEIHGRTQGGAGQLLQQHVTPAYANPMAPAVGLYGPVKGVSGASDDVTSRNTDKGMPGRTGLLPPI